MSVYYRSNCASVDLRYPSVVVHDKFIRFLLVKVAINTLFYIEVFEHFANN